ncbi:MAG: hypothetical protein P1U74_09790 [Legionellaceae bacterium]|nr:hypothetical protein [Legionellaceae bacterium]
MGRPNPHFHYLHLTNPESVKESLSRSLYAMLAITLPRDKQVSIGDKNCIILDAHVSFYQTYEVFSYKNDYHVTAHINSDSGDAYTLHVYFGATEELLCEPILKDSYDARIDLSEDDKNKLLILAQAYSAPIIKKFRAEYQQDTKKYLDDLDINIQNLFETSVSHALTQIDGLIERAEILELITKERRVKILRGYKLALQDIAAAEHDIPKLVSEEDGKLTSSQASIMDSYVIIDKSSSLNSNQEIFDKDLAVLLETEGLIEEDTSSKNSISLERAFNYAREAKKTLEASLYEGVHVEPHIFLIMHRNIISSQKICSDLLTRALIGRDPSLYSQPEAVNYAAYVKEEILHLLINIKANDAFQWLINNGDFDLNTVFRKFPKDTVELSLLERAYNTKNIDCFISLLNSGVTPFFITANGRPFAHDVLQKEDEFTSAIYKYANKSLFKNLITLINVCLSDDKLSASEKADLESMLDYYKIERRGEIVVKSDLIDKALNMREKVISMMNIPTSQMQQIKRSSLIQLALDRLASAYEGYQGILSSQERRVVNASATKQINGLTSMMESKPLFNDESEFNEDEIITNINQEASLLESATELIRLKNEYEFALNNLKSCSAKKVPKRLKQLEKNYKDCIRVYKEKEEQRFPESRSRNSSLQALKGIRKGLLNLQREFTEIAGVFEEVEKEMSTVQNTQVSVTDDTNIDFGEHSNFEDYADAHADDSSCNTMSPK